MEEELVPEEEGWVSPEVLAARAGKKVEVGKHILEDPSAVSDPEASVPARRGENIDN